MGLVSQLKNAMSSMFGAAKDAGNLESWEQGRGSHPVGGDRIVTNPYPPPYQSPTALDRHAGETSEMRLAYLRFYAVEPAFQAAIDGKVAAIASLDISVLPEDENSEKDKRAAEFVRDSVANAPGGWCGLIERILRPAFLTGYSITEKVLDGVAEQHEFLRLRRKWSGLWAPRELAEIDTEYLRFQLDETRRIIGIVNTRRGLEGYSPDRVIIYTNRKLFENPYGRSDGRSAFRACQLIENAYKLWYVAIKNYSAPFFAVKTGSQGAVRSKLISALEEARGGGWTIVGKEDELEVVNFAASTSFQAFERKVDKCRQEIYLAVRGAFLPFLEGMQQDGRGDTETHKTASDTLEALIVQGCLEVINKQLVPDLVLPNFGESCGIPTVTLGGTNWAETKTQLEVVNTVEKTLGRPVSSKHIYKISQLEPPRDGTDGPPAPPQPPAPPPQGGGFPFSETLNDWMRAKLFEKPDATPPDSPYPAAALTAGPTLAAASTEKPATGHYADVIVTNDEGRVLILLRSPDEDFCPNQWCLPGGKVEAGEVPLAAAVREVAEESGVELDELKRFKDYSNPDGTVSHAFTAAAKGVSIRTDASEHTNHLWVSDTRKSYPRIPFMLQTKERLDEFFASNQGGAKKDFSNYTFDAEDCPKCGVSMEGDPYNGKCNSCGHKWGKEVAGDKTAATFSEAGPEPVTDDAPPPKARIAIAGEDGQAAMHLAKAAMDDGRAVLESITRDALTRKLKGHTGPLFNADETELLAEAIASTTATAELLGRYRIRERLEKKDTVRRFHAFDPGDGGPPRVNPIPPAQALDYFRHLMPSLAIFPGFDERHRRTSFTLAVNTGDVILRQIQNAITTAIGEGRNGQYVVDDLLDKAGVSPRNPQYGDMVFRTNAMESFNVGHDAERLAADVVEEFPVWEYLGIDDERAGDDHRPRFGKFYPSKATFNEVRGERPFNCRCSQRAIDRGEWARRLKAGAVLETKW